MKYLLIALGALVMVGPATAAPKWDLNGDGKMTKNEFAPMVSSRMLGLADTDKDGFIVAAGLVGNLENRFDRQDADKDGILSDEERQAAREVTKANR